MILSLGLVYRKQNQNPVVLTLDKNFQSKAMMLDIPLVTMYELLGIKEDIKDKTRPVIKTKTNIDYKTIFKQIKPNKRGEVTIPDFINQIKIGNPDFDFRKLGHETEFKFAFSLRIFNITEYKFLKLK